jgi:predicted amidohydrolase
MPHPDGRTSAITVAAIQMNSNHDLEKNLRRADELLLDASRRGCQLSVLPENFAFLGLDDADKVALAELEGSGPIQGFVAEAAQRHSMWIVAGSIPLVSPDAGRCFGASIVFDPDGRQRACYRKIHLFDVDVPERDESYQESATMYPGDELCVCDTPLGRLGMTICYDVRFPELYRKLLDLGAVAFTVPSAFTAATGEAHWQVLLRARAVENLAYVIAPGQEGRHSNGRLTFGHSVIVDPWGRVLAQQERGEGVVVADIEPGLADELRGRFPVLEHRQSSAIKRELSIEQKQSH